MISLIFEVKVSRLKLYNRPTKKNQMLFSVERCNNVFHYSQHDENPTSILYIVSIEHILESNRLLVW